MSGRARRERCLILLVLPDPSGHKICALGASVKRVSVLSQKKKKGKKEEKRVENVTAPVPETFEKKRQRAALHLARSAILPLSKKRCSSLPECVR